MTRDEKQLIRMMNKSFSEKKNSRSIEVKDLSKETDSSASKSEANETVDEDPFDPYHPNYNFIFDLDNPSHEGTIDLPKEKEPENSVINPESVDRLERISLTEDDFHCIVKECIDEIMEKIKNGELNEDSDSDTVYEIDMDDHLDTGLEIDEVPNDKDEVLEFKPLVQHFTLSNPWLPYEKDLKLNKFVIYQDDTVDLEFDIIFNRPPHLRHEPSDLNDPLKILNQFKALMDKSDANGNNIKCSIIYNNAPDNAIIKSTTIYSIIGKITSMEILQNYGLGLRIKIKGRIPSCL